MFLFGQKLLSGQELLLWTGSQELLQKLLQEQEHAPAPAGALKCRSGRTLLISTVARPIPFIGRAATERGAERAAATLRPPSLAERSITHLSLTSLL